VCVCNACIIDWMSVIRKREANRAHTDCQNETKVPVILKKTTSSKLLPLFTTDLDAPQDPICEGVECICGAVMVKVSVEVLFSAYSRQLPDPS